MRILAEQLGLVEAERFIALLRREPFDYTKWRQGLFKDIPLETFLHDAQQYRDARLREQPAALQSRPDNGK
jgi:ferric-dicitrate binding protein FerR (iron transport regulator)